MTISRQSYVQLLQITTSSHPEGESKQVYSDSPSITRCVGSPADVDLPTPMSSRSIEGPAPQGVLRLSNPVLRISIVFLCLLLVTFYAIIGTLLRLPCEYDVWFPPSPPFPITKLIPRFHTATFILDWLILAHVDEMGLGARGLICTVSESMQRGQVWLYLL